MGYTLPEYRAPEFSQQRFLDAPNVAVAPCEVDGIAPQSYHSTSIYPEYFKVDGTFRLALESRMDCVVALREDGALDVVETRSLRVGDRVILGRTENGEDGIYLHANGFTQEAGNDDQFVFRQGRSRETAFSRDYDNLYSLLKHEREHGNILWVAGPAVAFDYDSRRALQKLVEHGFVDGLLAGNALATHDLEAGYLRTALGQDIYTQKSLPSGHYNHLDTINEVRRSGSIPRFIKEQNINDGVLYSLVRNDVPYVLTGSIRDDGPLPEVIHSAYEGQAAMRNLVRKATTILCLATQLHTIATGNMAPCFRVVQGQVRPLFLYSIDISEFATNKLGDRGSLSSIAMVTNVQDFIVNVAKGVGAME